MPYERWLLTKSVAQNVFLAPPASKGKEGILTDAPATRLEAAIFRIDNNLGAFADDLARIQFRLLQVEERLRRIEIVLAELGKSTQ